MIDRRSFSLFVASIPLFGCTKETYFCSKLLDAIILSSLLDASMLASIPVDDRDFIEILERNLLEYKNTYPQANLTWIIEKIDKSEEISGKKSEVSWIVEISCNFGFPNFETKRYSITRQGDFVIWSGVD